jgi:hypothetical protein
VEKKSQEEHIIRTPNKSNKKTEVWIGLIEVKQKKDIAGPLKNKGAYVNALSWASSVAEYRANIKKAIKECNLAFVNMQRPELLNERLKKFRLKKPIIKLGNLVRRTKKTRFGTFHSFPKK